MAATLTSRETEQQNAAHGVAFPPGRSEDATTERTGSPAGGKVFKSSDLVNASNDYEPRLSSAVEESFGLQPRTKPVTTCLTCGHDLPVIESQAESDRRYATALASDLRARGEVYSASLVERLTGLLSIEPRDVTRDCCDTISDKLSDKIQHCDGRLMSFEEEIEMELSEDFTAAPLIVLVRKDGFDFEFSLKSVLRNPWRLRSGKWVILKYSVEIF